jgi:putative redox protein
MGLYYDCHIRKELEQIMAIEKVTVEWVRDQVFILNDHLGFPIVMALPEGVLGADLLPLSLIGCAIWDVMNILRKQKQNVSRFEVEAQSERDDDPPWRFQRIRVLYRIWGNGLEKAAIERAIRLNEDKYCSTYATLKPALEILSDYEHLSAEGRE